VARVPRPAGRWARLNSDAISMMLGRASISAKELYERAGMSSPTFYARRNGKVPMSLNDVEAFARILNVSPLEVAVLANHLGELTPDTPESTGAAGQRRG